MGFIIRGLDPALFGSLSDQMQATFHEQRVQVWADRFVHRF
jgi:hypothetical protein